MEKQLQQILTTHNISPHRNQGILIVPVPDQATGIRVAKDILYEIVDKKTALFLSGGKTPKEILKRIAQEKKLEVGVVGQVDERYGKPMHENSNELMFDATSFLDYLREEGITFHSMLESKGMDSRLRGNDKVESKESLAEHYDQLLRGLFTVYQKSVATLGIGQDGHIAGIAPNRHDFSSPLFGHMNNQELVSSFADEKGAFGERITMTFLGLSMMDVLIPIVFGEDKKDALEKMFEAGREEEVPVRFLKREEIANKTIVITDQHV